LQTLRELGKQAQPMNVSQKPYVRVVGFVDRPAMTLEINDPSLLARAVTPPGMFGRKRIVLQRQSAVR
jgi:hypothetical protein